MRSGAMPEPVHGPDASTRRCGPGRCRSTSGSAAPRPERRSRRWRADLAGDEWTAMIARKVALGVVLPAPALLIADLGRPGRFLNMLRIFKPRSPMNLGAWCLAAFSATGAGAVGADLLGWRRAAQGARRRAGAPGLLPRLLHRRPAGHDGGAGVGAQPRVPGADLRRHRDGDRGRGHATDARCRRPGPRTSRATSRWRIWKPARSSPSWSLSTINERRLGRAGEVLSQGTPRALFRAAKTSVATGLVLPLLARRHAPAGGSPRTSRASSISRAAWHSAWRGSRPARRRPRDNEAVALMARGRVTSDERHARRDRAAGRLRRSRSRSPAVPRGRRCACGPAPSVGASLLIERLVRARANSTRAS